MIYCVEDDASIRDIEIYALNSAGLAARGFENPKDFWAALHEALPDLVILDVMLPDQDGVDILRQLRSDAATERIPVIMATAKGTEFDKIRSLDLGADDYLVKPFSILEMISRVKAVLRRSSSHGSSPLLQSQGLILDAEQHTVTADGERISLTLKEFELLRTFLSQPGVAFTREQLLSLVWKTDFVGETRTVDMHIRTLRLKLGSCGERIQTVRGVGYRLENNHDR